MEYIKEIIIIGGVMYALVFAVLDYAYNWKRFNQKITTFFSQKNK